MEVLKNKAIINLKEYLLEKVKLDITIFEIELENSIKSVSFWKFATDEMYCPIPFFSELNKLKKGRTIKNISIEKSIDKTNVYSFGFSKNEKLLIVQKSNGLNLGINYKVYIYNEKNSSIEYFSLRTYLDKKFSNKLISIGILTNIQNNLQFDVNVSSNAQNWSATIYEFEKQLVNRVYRYSQGWNGQTEYTFEYENESINKIKVGNTVWWSTNLTEKSN